MRSSFAPFAVVLSLLLAAAAAACSSSNSGTSTPDQDAAVVDAAGADTSPGTNDSGPGDGGDGGLTDGPADDGQAFCKTAAAEGSAFCADFEDSTNAGDEWEDVSTDGTATMTIETSIAKQSKCALAKFVSAGDDDGTAAFSAVAGASGTKSKVVLEFDGRFVFPNGPPATNTLFLTVAVRTGSGPSGQYFIDLERGASGWHLLASGTSEVPFPGIGEDAWHHFRLSYDGSGAKGETHFFVDGLAIANISGTKGSGPGDAPSTFDNLFIEHLGIVTNTSVSFYIDNVIVTYP